MMVGNIAPKPNDELAPHKCDRDPCCVKVTTADNTQHPENNKKITIPFGGQHSRVVHHESRIAHPGSNFRF